MSLPYSDDDMLLMKPEILDKLTGQIISAFHNVIKRNSKDSEAFREVWYKLSADKRVEEFMKVHAQNFICKELNTGDIKLFQAGKESGMRMKTELYLVLGVQRVKPKLKPCPFCGSANVVVSDNKWDSNGFPVVWVYFVLCTECDANGPAFRLEPGSIGSPKLRAMELWNTRKADDASNP